eukprot:353615-Chlamydomonas_euryale.AAC.14
MGKGRDGQAGGQLKQSELDDILRYGAQELFAEEEPAAARSSVTEVPEGGIAPEAAPSAPAAESSAGISAAVSGTVAAATTPEPAGIEGAGAGAAPAAGLPSAATAAPGELTGKADAPAEQTVPSKTAVSDSVQAPANKPSNARIVWDDDAVARLLDRSELLARVGVEEEDDEDDDLMKAFKVGTAFYVSAWRLRAHVLHLCIGGSHHRSRCSMHTYLPGRAQPFTQHTLDQFVANFTMREEQEETGKKEEAEKAPDPEKLLQEVCPDQGIAWHAIT